MTHTLKKASARNKRKLSKHYYRTIIVECNICGGSDVTKIRIYGRKPKNHAHRRVELTTVDCGCTL